MENKTKLAEFIVKEQIEFNSKNDYSLGVNDYVAMLVRFEEEHEKPKKQWTINTNKPATERQLIAVKNLGGEIWEGMNQGEIEEQFKKINSGQIKPTEQIPKQNTKVEFTEKEKEQFPDY